MPDDWSPRFVPKQAPAVVEGSPALVNLPRATKDEPPPPVQLQSANLKGWRFVPERDANNLIVEIIATPIE